MRTFRIFSIFVLVLLLLVLLPVVSAGATRAGRMALQTTPSAPTLSAEMDTNCRAKPSGSSEILGYLFTGQKAEILGRDRAGEWWYIRYPSKPWIACWVWNNTTEVTGSTANVMINPAPMPRVLVTQGAAPVIHATINSNCRARPDAKSRIEGYLLVDQTAEVVGQDSSGLWWEIRNPDRLSGNCWVWNNSTYVTGDLSLISAQTSATPVASGTPQATAASVALTSGGLQTVNSVHLTYCGGQRAAIFGVRNRQAWAFESARITVEDLSNDTTLYGTIISDEPFLSDSRSCSPALDRLASGGKAFTGGTLSAILVPGHRVRGTFDFCSQEGLAGTCIEDVVEFIVP